MLNGARTGLALMMLAMTGSTALANGSAVAGNTPQTTPAPRQSPWIRANFKVPVLVETPNFKVVPLAPDLAKRDFDAYMSSIEHLQKTFTRSANWPHKDISAADAMRDMETEQARFGNRQSFAYAILSPDGRRERGCVYVSPSPVKGYDAVVRMWVRKDEYDAGFDAELYKWVVNWVRKDWPFAKVAYPGRAIEWSSWDAMVAAAKAGTPR